MKIHLTQEQFLQLKKLCHSSKKEIAGEMFFSKVGDNYYLQSVKSYNDESDYIASSNRKSIEFNNETYITQLLLECMNSKSSNEIVVRFHTHPGMSALAYPSNQDMKAIEADQLAVDKINSKCGKNLTFVEGIITSSEIGFYHCKEKTIRRIHTFVDGVEFIPEQPGSRHKKGIISSIKEGFNNGVNEAKFKR